VKVIRRIFLTTAIVATLTGVVAPAQAAKQLVPAKAPVTLTIATVDNPDMTEMEKLTPTFEKQYGINVKYDTLPENTLREKVTADVSTGGGEFDLATEGPYEIPQWAKNGWVTDLTPLFAKLSPAAAKAYDYSDLMPSVLSGLSYKGDVYAIPFYGESSMTYYNKAMFKAAGLSMPLHPTWDQIASFAKKLNDPSKNVYGICLRGDPGWGEMGAVLTTVINTFGGEWFNMAWQPQLTSPADEAAVNFYINLIRPAGEPGATSSGFTECETAVGTGKTAMWVDATVAAGDFSNPKMFPAEAGNIGYAFAPTKVTPLGSHWLWSWALAIEASSKQKPAAMTFLTWATSKSYLALVAADQGWASVPPGTRQSTYTNPKYLKVAPFASVVLNSMLTANPNHSTLNKVPYTGVQFVGIPEFQQIGTQVTQNLAAAITGSTSVDSALSLSQGQVLHTMTVAGYIK
jgi:sorbitol/mannitol transport system substrate-binding protein